MGDIVKAHDQKVTNRYVIAYPDHEPREQDPHYRDFHAYRKAHIDTAKCAWSVETGDDTQCAGGLELHHSHIEDAMLNAIDLSHLEHVYEGVSDPNTVGAWVQSGANLVFLCAKHHRASGHGIHHLSSSDYEASKFVTREVFGGNDD